MCFIPFFTFLKFYDSYLEEEGRKIFPLFHVSLPLLISEIPVIKEKLEFNRFALLIGSIFPDIIDKPIFLLGLGNGRFFSHTIFFILINFVILFLITKRNLKVSFPFLAGMSIHLILDFPKVPLFYPFILYDFVILEEPLGYWFSQLFTNPIVIITESIGIASLIFIIIHNKLYHVKDIKSFFKGNHLTSIIKEEK